MSAAMSMKALPHRPGRLDRLKPRQAGISLIEVLVAILIVSLGIISMAALLATSTRLGKASEFRSVAGLLAQDMADRIKANIEPAVAPNYYDLTANFAVLANAPANAAACAVAKGCTTAELAAIDLAQWRQALFYGLPNGTGYIQYDAVGRAVDLWVAWLDPSALSTGADEFKDLDDKSCPKAFQGNALRPRCMYFRVGL